MKQASHKTYDHPLPGLFLRKLITSIIVLWSAGIYAQEGHGFQIITTLQEKDLFISFSAKDTLRDVLVLVHDAAGEVCYSDHRRVYIGNYRQTVPLPAASESPLRLLVKCNGGTTRQTIIESHR